MKIRVSTKKSKNMEVKLASILERWSEEHRLTDVSLKKKSLILTFGDEGKGAKVLFKQYKKAKHANVEDAIETTMTAYQKYCLQCMGYKRLKVVETKKCWLVFWTN